MTLRHTATLTFSLKWLDGLGLTSQLGLSDHVKIGENELPRSWDVSKSFGSCRFERAYNRMVWELRKAVLMATRIVRIELDMDACDALTAFLAELRIDRGCEHAESEEFDHVLRYVQSARESLVETADAWGIPITWNSKPSTSRNMREPRSSTGWKSTTMRLRTADGTT